MTVIGVTPTTSYTPTGATAVTVVGGASIHAVLATAESVANYLTYTGGVPAVQNVRLVVGYNNPLTTNQALDGLWIHAIHQYWHEVGWFQPVRIVGFQGAVPHALNYGGVPVGAQVDPITISNYPVLPVNFHPVPQTLKATDGTLWQDCDRFEVEWEIYPVAVIVPPTNYLSYLYGTGGHLAKLGYAALMFTYTELPYATAIGPSGIGGPTTVPQPTITWWMAGSPQSSYQVVVVTSGAVDANGRTVFATGFDPLTASPVWDSGKVRSVATSDVSDPLVDGNHVTYIRLWTDSPRGELVGRWAYNSTWTVDADNVNPPAVSITNDATTYTVQTTIAPGTPTGGYVNPQVYEVQYLDPEQGWVPINVSGGTTVGNTTTIFYDSLKRPGTSISYRARSRYTRSDGLVALTAWVTASTTATDRKEWWLRCLTDRTLNRTLSSTASLVVQDWSPSRTRPQSVTWGIGAKYATVTHDVVKSVTMGVSVWAMTAAARTALYALLEHDGDLVLVSPWAEMWRVRVGDQIEETQQRAAPRSGETTPLGMVRVVSFTLIEVG